MKKYKKWLIGAIVVIVIIGVYKLLTRPKNKINYQTATAEKGDLITTVTASGTITTGNNVLITTSATGVIKNVYVKNGDRVKKGQKIAEITLDQNANQKYLSAYSSYLSAKNNLETAKTTLYSLDAAMWSAHQTFRNDAQERNLAADDPTYIQENDTWKAAEAKVINQQQVIKQAEINLQSTYLSYLQSSPVVYAPIDGTISNLNMAAGLALASNSTSSTDSLQKLGMISLKQGQIQATVNLTEIDITKIKAGQKATVTLDAFPGKTFAGTIAAFDTYSSTTSGVTSYPATLIFNTDLDNIYPGMAVNAQIIVEVKNEVILVPNAAIKTNNGITTIKVVKNDQINETEVVTGSSNDTQTEIISGINEGETIVVGTNSLKTTKTTNSGNSVFGGMGGSMRR